MGVHCLSGRFPGDLDEQVPKYPLVVLKCDDTDHSNCGLLQLAHSVPPAELYNHGYGYKSGINLTMSQHLQSITQYAEGIIKLTPDDLVLDIGSNDATLLKSYKSKITKVGIDPTGSEFIKYYTDDINLICDYFNASEFNYVYQKTA